MTARDDAELMRCVCANEPSAIEEIYARHAPMVFAVVLRIVRDRSAAEDVVQEVFIALWRSPGSYRAERGSLAAWLSVVARNRAIDAHRRGFLASPALAPAREPEAPDRTDEEVFRRLQATDVASALKALPYAQRQAIVLSYFAGVSQREIAGRFGIPLGTVKGRVRLALRKLSTTVDPPGSQAGVRSSPRPDPLTREREAPQ